MKTQCLLINSTQRCLGKENAQVASGVREIVGIN